MNRRKFLNSTSKYALGLTLPYLLPSGRLFAATGNSPKVKHVVFCLFAGGIRNWESVDFKEGNLMPNTLRGDHSISEDLLPAIENVPRVFDEPIQKFGTLLKSFNYKSTTTLHYNAHAAAISGQYCNSIDLMKPIPKPSIFEYFRKHTLFENKALNAWWVSDQLGPFPYLQYSKHSKYGYPYAANMIQPSTLFKMQFSTGLSVKKNQSVRQLSDIIRNFDTTNNKASIFSQLNSIEDQVLIKNFLQNISDNHFSKDILWDDLSQNLINDDLVTMFTATEILKAFHPHFLVVNMQESDIGHSDFSGYCNNIGKADYALAKLWQTIQNDATLKNNTVLIAAPEFGRNKSPNTILDSLGRYAVDHTGDEISQKMFCLVVGPENVIQQNKEVTESYGEITDIVPTIAELLGFKDKIPPSLLNGKVLYETLV